MRRSNKQITTTFIICSLLLIGVIYAILQANLQINGTAKIQANTWDIHFDNIQVNENSVSIGTGDSQATIDPENNCKVDFEVTLSLPGDFYEFTIDVVNAGTIDGMIGTLNKTLKVNNEVVSEIPDYLEYTVTYSDGVEIEENHKIDAGTTETYLVRLEFRTDIDELPSATTITTSLQPQYLQADTNATPIFHYHSLYNVLKEEKENGSGLAREFTGTHKDSFVVPATEKIYIWYASTDNDVETIKNKDNIIFGGFCWKILRTTDTGGIKIIYNGIAEEGICDKTGDSTSIGSSKFNESYLSPSFAGYMYNENAVHLRRDNYLLEGTIYGADVVYNDGMYTLTDTSLTIDNYHHYNCSDGSITCQEVLFNYSYINVSSLYYYAYKLSNGMKIEDLLEAELNADNVNQTNSTIKTKIDNWYRNNLIDYTSKLEDIIFCNDRKINSSGGSSKTGNIRSPITYTHYYSPNNSFDCVNETDQFSVSNPKAQLLFPVALASVPEVTRSQKNAINYSGTYYWTMTPYSFSDYANNYNITNQGILNNNYTGVTWAVRPVVSLKPGTKYRYGDGSKNNPYIVE